MAYFGGGGRLLLTAALARGCSEVHETQRQLHSERPPSTDDGSVASLRHPAWLQAMAMVSQQLSTAQIPWEKLPKSCNFWPSLSLTSFMNLLSLLSFIFLSLEAPFSLQKRMFQLKINKGAWQIKTEFSAISQMVLSIHLLICFTLWLM